MSPVAHTLLESAKCAWLHLPRVDVHRVAREKSQARAQDLCLPGQGALPHPADPQCAHPAPQARCIGSRRLANPPDLGLDLVFDRRGHFLYAVLVFRGVCLPPALLEMDQWLAFSET